MRSQLIIAHGDRLSPHLQCECDRYLKKSIKSADRVVVVWGNNGKLMQRDRFVLELLSKHNTQPHCLGITKAGYPSHPLYVMCSKELIVY